MADRDPPERGGRPGETTRLSPLAWGVPLAIGLVLVGAVVWLVFSTTEDTGRPEDAAGKGGRKQLTKEEFAVIAADDDENSDDSANADEERAREAERGERDEKASDEAAKKREQGPRP